MMEAIEHNPELSMLFRNARAVVYQELENRPEPVALSDEQKERLSKNLPPCIAHILNTNPKISLDNTYNRISMILCAYCKMAGYDETSAMEIARPFVDGYPHSQTYITPEARRREWFSVWNHIQKDASYQWNCSYVLGLGLPGNAFSCEKCALGERGNNHKEIKNDKSPQKASSQEDKPRTKEMRAEQSLSTIKGQKKETQSKILLKLNAPCQIFHTPAVEPYARIPVDGHKEIHHIRSNGFRNWLGHRFFLQEGKAPSAQAMTDALNVLEGKAKFAGPEIDVHVRVAEKDDHIYVDLANQHWEAVDIRKEGWTIIQESPVYFRRPRGMSPLPRPAKNGNIGILKSLLNLPDGCEAEFQLIVGWLVQAFRPVGPYPVLLLTGEQGSAKSTASRLLRLLVDPNEVPLRTVPRTERDLAIACGNSWVVALDNLSGLQTWLSDALCRISTGGGFSTRELYQNREEALFNYMRPIIINGIDNVVHRHDLADRAIHITLPYISEQQRLPETELMQRFSKAVPGILGGICDAISTGLRNIKNVRLSTLPRMADFALWITAAEPALPWQAGKFMAVYGENRSKIIESALEADSVGSAILEMMDGLNKWSGTSSELLYRLDDVVDDKTKQGKFWPKVPSALGKRLRRAASFLRQGGIEITFPLRSNKRREITIQKVTGGDRKQTQKSPSNINEVTDSDTSDREKHILSNNSTKFLEARDDERKKRELNRMGKENTVTAVTTVTGVPEETQDDWLEGQL